MSTPCQALLCQSHVPPVLLEQVGFNELLSSPSPGPNISLTNKLLQDPEEQRHCPRADISKPKGEIRSTLWQAQMQFNSGLTH